MKILWAVGCRKTLVEADGLKVSGLGVDGVDISGVDIPFDLAYPMIICFEADPGDEQGVIYEYKVEVEDPSGTIYHFVAAVSQRRDTSPQLISPERYYLPGSINLPISEAGLYTLRFVDTKGELFVLPVRIVALPTP